MSDNSNKTRSHPITIWVSSIAAIISVFISAFSLYLSFQIKNNNEKEACFLSVQRVNENYNTEFHMFGTSGITTPTEHYYLLIYYDVTIVNIGEKPISVIAYNMREHNQDSDYRHEIKLDAPIKLDSGASYILRIPYNTKIDKKVYALLRKKFPIDDSPKIVSVLREILKSQSDMFGNPIECEFSKDKIKNMAVDFKKLNKDDPFIVTIKTAKGNYFSTSVRWHYDDLIPFGDLL